ncbi:hypothetical protein GCM10007973_18090 [Polymorphobacter multimanifer]|uniref:Uncharacterized protein n=1 Tax=Polymorphobacter multimanifer TaxID=1070431 RepID=A0A841LBH3_9SPHN|nr:hypothetical protein [Polymorphobacter multimanifer]MBB6228323.1 hypothetical protein [Polymorphobacter multimanifer]GGI82032.1 hypothetical protein GCM10007973_18090 [Polymorphobacter multimanifer]
MLEGVKFGMATLRKGGWSLDYGVGIVPPECNGPEPALAIAVNTRDPQLTQILIMPLSKVDAFVHLVRQQAKTLREDVPAGLQ